MTISRPFSSSSDGTGFGRSLGTDWPTKNDHQQRPAIIIMDITSLFGCYIILMQLFATLNCNKEGTNKERGSQGTALVLSPCSLQFPDKSGQFARHLCPPIYQSRGMVALFYAWGGLRKFLHRTALAMMVNNFLPISLGGQEQMAYYSDRGGL